MPLAVLCAASMDHPGGEIQIDQHDDTANVSQDIHRAIAMELQGKPRPELDGESERLIDKAVDWFKHDHISSQQYAAAFEHHIEVGNHCGTLDVYIRRFAKFATVIDWKLTYRDDNHEAQLISYAWLLFASDVEIEEVEIYTVFLRLGHHDSKILTRDWVMSWMEEFIRNNYAHRDIFSAGEHCSRCTRFASCPALKELNKSTALTLATIETPESLDLTVEQASALWPRVRLLEKTIDHFRNFVKDYVKAVGPIDLPNGKQLRTVPIKRDTIHALPAWELLAEKFTDEEMDAIIHIPKGALEEAIAKKAAPRCKGKDKETFMAALWQAKAVTREEEIQVKECSKKEILGE